MTESAPLYRRTAIHCRQNTCTGVHPPASQQLCRSHGDCNTTVSIQQFSFYSFTFTKSPTTSGMDDLSNSNSN